MGLGGASDRVISLVVVPALKFLVQVPYREFGVLLAPQPAHPAAFLLRRRPGRRAANAPVTQAFFTVDGKAGTLAARRGWRDAIHSSSPTSAAVGRLALCHVNAYRSVEVTLWGREHLAFLRRFYPFTRGIPSHDTLCDVFAALDPDLFRACFLAWVEDLRDDAPDVVAIDGKTTRGSRDTRKGGNPLHLVSAWATRQRLVLGQQATPDKSNEITAIPLLLQRLDLQGALVTIDAMGTQTEIAQAIRDGGGDYCLALKTNWPLVHAEVEMLFNDPPADMSSDTYGDVDKNGGGRIEVRRHSICHKVDWLRSDRRYPGAPVFPDLAAIGRVEVEIERVGKAERQVRYFLLSTALDARTLARVVRGHWGVENRLHWVLDVVFREDLKRLRTGHAAQNMAIVRHAAINLLNKATPNTSLKNRRKRAGWNTEYLVQPLKQTA